MITVCPSVSGDTAYSEYEERLCITGVEENGSTSSY